MYASDKDGRMFTETSMKKKNTFKSESESESWLAREKEISERNTGIKQYSYLFIIAE